MIKTIKPVGVETRNKRDTEQKVVYANIYKTEFGNDKYVFYIEEFVYDDVEISTINEDGEETTEIQQVKRNVLSLTRVREKAKVQELIDLLQDDTQLANFGLDSEIGVYTTLGQLEKNDFVKEIGHLIENNQALIRGVNWVKHIEEEEL